MDSEQLLAIASAGLAASEALSFIPKVKSNGIFQLVWNILKILITKKK